MVASVGYMGSRSRTYQVPGTQIPVMCEYETYRYWCTLMYRTINNSSSACVPGIPVS